MNNILNFEGQEIKVKTNEGKTLINLVHTAKSCGLVERKNGKEYVRWTERGVSEKLKKILSHNCENSDSVVAEEITYILEEIENTDDRNSIYMSSWLSKRLALECHSDRAMRYKNFLVSLDEARENEEVQDNTYAVTLAQNAVQSLMPVIANEIINKFAPMIERSEKQVNEIAGLLKDQSLIYDHDRNDLKELIGLRAVNTKRLVDKLKETLSDTYGFNVKASTPVFQKAKNKIFKEFKVIKWEDIPVSKYNHVHAYIDGIDEILSEVACTM